MNTGIRWCRGVWRTLALVAGLAVLVAGVPATTAAENGEDKIPFKLRAELEGVLQARVGELLKDKNEDGRSYKRGSYSKSFREAGDSKYRVTFLQDTAGKDNLTTERFLLTLGKDNAGKWAVVEEKLEDTYKGLYRWVMGDEDFYRFDRFEIDREGFKVTASNGALWKDYYQGEVVGFTLVADNMTYDYDPPADLGYHQLHRFNVKDYPGEFDFTPERFWVWGDAASCKEIIESSFTGLRSVSESEAGSTLSNVYKEWRKEYDEKYRENAFYGFKRPYDEDRRTYRLAVKRAGAREHWNHLDYDNYDGWQVHFGSTGLGAEKPDFVNWLYGYYSEDVRNSGANPYELEMRPDAEAKYYELYSLKGKVDVALEDAETVEADITYGVRAKMDLAEIPFNISRIRLTPEEEKLAKSPTMFVNSIQDGEGNELTWMRTGSRSGLVVLPEGVSAGEKFTLRMQFRNEDSIYKLNPSYSAMDRGGWLPFVRFGDMIDEFDMTIRSPDKYDILGIGTKLSDTRKDGIRTAQFTSNSPVEFPTIIFGEYISDKPSFDAKKSDGTVIPVTVHVDKVSTHTLREQSFEELRDESDVDDLIEDVEAVQSGARGIRGKQLQAIGEQAANSLNLYREVFDVDYPYGKLDLVNDPLGFLYGQAPSSIIYLGAGVFRGEGTMAGGGSWMFDGGGTGTAKFLKSVVAHEVGHQWWGSVVANANSRNYWFVESLAEYSSALYLENVYGWKEYQEQVEEWRDTILRFDVKTSVQNASALWGGEFPGAAYVASVYNKGPYAFHTLRMTYGDEKFFKFLKKLAKDLKSSEIVTRDIQHVAEEAYGLPMEWFFDQWIRGEGIPEYSFNYTTRQTEDGNYLVQGVVKQRVVVGKEKHVLDGVYYLGVVPVTVKARKSDKEYRVPIRVEGPESQFAFKVPEEPVEVAFNKYGDVLAHDVKVNESW